jgi:glycosyltransferase involved in cell wall biosynthesis
MRVYNEGMNLPKSLDNLFSFCDEVVISDGGSTDWTYSVVQSYQSQGHNITWLDYPGGSISEEIHFNHEGRQLNFGLDHCKGKWVITKDVDIVHCDRITAKLRQILEETNHDAFNMYGVHLIGNWDHYAEEAGTGPGLIQLFRNKGGVRFLDKKVHVAGISDYNWSNRGLLRGGLFHWGNIDRDEEIAKLQRLHKAMPENDLFRRIAANPPTHNPAPIPWERCHSECEVCWMQEAAR